MIPAYLRNLAEKQLGNVFRKDREAVLQALSDLKIPVESEFGEFYLNYVTVNFGSKIPCSTLCDITKPYPEIIEVAEFARDLWELPEHFICITSTEGEGCFLYDRCTGKVWDFSLETRDDFIAGREKARWGSFFEFMTWYLGGEDHKSDT
jgi:hypothetical protein